jgi:hypothetical protein
LRLLRSSFNRAALVVIVAIAAFAIARVWAAPSEQSGTFALLGGTPKIVSQISGQRAALSVILRVRQFQLDGTTPILHYDVDMQRLMHLVVIRDDFATFDHLHPAFDDATGTFSQPITEQPNHRYYVYADTMPSGIGQQVFRFTMDPTRAVPKTKEYPFKASSPNAHAGPYTVILAKTTIAANTPINLDLTVVKGDDPANDLTPYLGAAAHVVLIDTKTLEYVHVHPMLRGQSHSMSMSGMSGMSGTAKAGPFMQLELPALPPGAYKTWVQFAVASTPQPYVAPFTIIAR